MPLKDLSLTAAKNITDFSVLPTLPLERLALQETAIRDLGILRGLSLKFLNVAKTAVSDLQPLRGMPLELLLLDETEVTDLSPLLDCPTLKEITLPPKARNVELLRQLPHVERLSHRRAGEHPAQTAAEFWNEYDAQNAAGRK